MLDPPRVLSIGQCGFDDAMLRKVFADSLGASLQSADSCDEGLRLLSQGHYALVLINRILDASGAAGLNVLKSLISEHPGMPMMLVSNYEDAQRNAVAAGALRGFGKAELTRPATLERIRVALCQTPPAAAPLGE